MISYAVLVLLWLAWCTLHSALISPGVTGFFRARFPKGFRYYRLVYNLVAALSLVPVLFYTVSLRGEPFFAWEGPWRGVQGLLILCALFLFAAGARRYDSLQFLGIRQIREGEACEVLTDDCRLDASGVLGVVRHPWYTGGILIVWARPLDAAAVLTNLVITAYFIVGALLEERKLGMQFGREYEDYRGRVSMFLPVKWIGRGWKSRKESR